MDSRRDLAGEGIDHGQRRCWDLVDWRVEAVAARKKDDLVTWPQDYGNCVVVHGIPAS